MCLCLCAYGNGEEDSESLHVCVSVCTRKEALTLMPTCAGGRTDTALCRL
jgi:hypothetical protein